MTALFLLTCSVLLTGCPDPVVVYKFVKDQPPSELLDCPDVPPFQPRRLGHKPSQGDAAHYIVDLKTDLHTCHTNVEALKGWANGQ